MTEEKTIEKKINKLLQEAWQYRYTNRKKSLELANTLLEESKEQAYLKGICFSKLNILLLEFWQGGEKNFLQEALDCHNFFHASKDLLGLTRSKNILALIYDQYGQYEKALHYASNAVGIAKEMGNKSAVADALTTLGQVYSRIKEYPSAIDCFKHVLAVREELKDDLGKASALNLLGRNHLLNKDFSASEEYYQKSLELRSQIGDINGLPWTYVGLASLFESQEQAKKSITYYQQATQSANKNDSRLRLLCLLGKAKNQLKINQNTEAEKNLVLALKLSQELNIKSLQAEVLEQLSILEESKKNYQQSLNYIKQFHQIRETILNSETANQLKQQQIAMAVEQAEKEALLFKEKNKEIRSSIEYAKMLQETILCSPEIIAQEFPEHFILFQPKDIVSGDFYWFHSKKEIDFIAVADCTGHGVPGAMVSMVCNNALNKIIIEENESDTAKILEKVSQEVRSVFKKEGAKSEANDGMDIALCGINKQRKLLRFSGANRPLVIIRNNEVLEVDADRKSIGGAIYEDNTFSKQEIVIEKGDVIYLFSDGYVDQFGGENGKKLKSKPFKELLLSVHSLNMDVQKEKLMDAFEKWKGNLEQIDDVCVMGVKI
jgi:serine phosphatase RsbU (regulator of sigma subunit)/uncharacterized protein HemY